MIKTKKAWEIKRIKKACAILAIVKKKVYDAIKPGITTKELDSLAFNEIKKLNGIPAFLNYHGFPATICASVNEVLIHGLPNDYKLKEGDVISVDMGVIWKGYYSDSAFTKGVGKISKEDAKLINVAKEAFYAGIDQIKPGARVGDIESAIGQLVKLKGYFVPKDFTGHGVGKKLHEPPSIFNYGTKGTGPLLKDGMVLAIEPMILQGSNEIIYHEDGWSIIAKSGKKTSHYEHTILIENGKAKILTGGI